MPPEQAVHHVPPLPSQAITKQRALENYFPILKDIHTESKCPEHNGYNTRLCRQADMLPQPHTKVAFLPPLVDRPSAHPDTIKTAIERGQSLARAAGEDVLISIADQQLYKVITDILFYEPLYFKFVIPVFGVMHMFMNFIHAAAIIKAGSGVKAVLAVTFGSIDKMLNGMKYPQIFRALKTLVEKLFRDVVQEPEVISFTRPIEVLEVRTSCSRTTKIWTNNGDHNHHVKTVIIIMNVSCGGHEGNWALRLFAAEAKFP